MFILFVLFTETSDIFACYWFEFPFNRWLSKACWIWERQVLNADVFLETCLAVKIVSTIRSQSRSPSSQRLWKRAGRGGESKDLLSFETSQFTSITFRIIRHLTHMHDNLLFNCLHHWHGQLHKYNVTCSVTSIAPPRLSSTSWMKFSLSCISFSFSCLFSWKIMWMGLLQMFVYADVQGVPKKRT